MCHVRPEDEKRLSPSICRIARSRTQCTS